MQGERINEAGGGRSACIRAIATYLPPAVEENEGEAAFIEKLGIRARHIAAEDAAASDLAVQAAEALFRAYGIDRKSIDFLLLCTQTPDYLVPTTACIVQDRIGLPKTCGALDYNLGCSGYVYGLALSKGLLETGLSRRLLLVTTSIYSKYSAKEDGIVRPLFGDGATATLLECMPGKRAHLDAFVFGTDGAGYDKIIAPVGGSRAMPQHVPVEREEDARGNRRTNYDLHMDGTGITLFSMRTVPGLIEETLSCGGIRSEDLDYAVFHQANKYMLERLRIKCGLEDVPFYNDVRDIGNTVSGTLPFALNRIVASEDTKALKRVLLAGFGVGLSWGGCVADLSAMLPRIGEKTAQEREKI